MDDTSIEEEPIADPMIEEKDHGGKKVPELIKLIKSIRKALGPTKPVNLHISTN